jgi:hypothetical protein
MSTSQLLGRVILKSRFGRKNTSYVWPNGPMMCSSQRLVDVIRYNTFWYDVQHDLSFEIQTFSRLFLAAARNAARASFRSSVV